MRTFIAGPRSFKWSGYCEVRPEDGMYRHVTPTYTSGWYPFEPQKPIEVLIRDEEWVEVTNITVPEGL